MATAGRHPSFTHTASCPREATRCRIRCILSKGRFVGLRGKIGCFLFKGRFTVLRGEVEVAVTPKVSTAHSHCATPTSHQLYQLHQLHPNITSQLSGATHSTTHPTTQAHLTTPHPYPLLLLAATIASLSQPLLHCLLTIALATRWLG